MNRYTRDEIVLKGLSMANVPTLLINDAPDGTLLPDALSISWFQEAIDLFHNKFPWASRVINTPLAIPAGKADITPPLDFILDVRDGFLYIDTSQLQRRLKRLPFQKWLSTCCRGTSRLLRRHRAC